ncbi:MAG: hypothetical protein WC916_06270 [Candidatus Woesearchaeota archaeon]
MKKMDDQGIPYKSFDGKNAVRDEIHKFLLKKDPKFLFLNGHGNKDSIEGTKGNIIFDTTDKDLFKGKMVYARSCLLGQNFGKEIFQHNDGCFIGYVNPFIFFIDDTQSHPSRDKIAGYYLEPSNEIALSIIKGNSAQESHDRGRKAMLKNMKKLLLEENHPAGVVEALWNNFDGQVLFGDGEIRF